MAWAETFSIAPGHGVWPVRRQAIFLTSVDVFSTQFSVEEQLRES